MHDPGTILQVLPAKTQYSSVQQLVPENDSPEAANIAIPIETAVEVRKILDLMPSRSILDLLVRYFVTKVNWFASLSHAISRKY